MSDKYFNIQIATDVIRNPTIKHDTFYVYAKLIQHYFVFKEKSNKLSIEHKKFMYFANIKSNQTFKKVLNQLFENKLILNKIDTLPRHSELKIVINDDYLKSGKSFKFAQFPYWMLDKYILDNIKYEGFRLLYYFKSYISEEKNFCFTSRETISKDIGSNPKNVDKYTEILRKNKLIKIVKHKIESTYEYKLDEFGIEKEQFSKFNNHYYLPETEGELKKITEKMKERK